MNRHQQGVGASPFLGEGFRKRCKNLGAVVGGFCGLTRCETKSDERHDCEDARADDGENGEAPQPRLGPGLLFERCFTLGHRVCGGF